MAAFAKNDPTPAQEELNQLLGNNTGDDGPRVHPADREDARREADDSEEDEEDRYRNEQIEAAMRMPALRGPTEGADIKLPPAQFDAGRSTGVKGVIADARSYEEARKSKWRTRVRAARRSVFGLGDVPKSNGSNSGDSEEELDPDEEEFLKQWRETRKLQLEAEAGQIRNRRTSPSLRMFGHFDTVDALGYLDAIERVGRDTTVVVFVYDQESQISMNVEKELRPLVAAYPQIHFVKVPYHEIEFDDAAVPTILAYRNQGDLFANMTSVIDLMPEDEHLTPDSLKKLFKKHGVL